MADPTRFNGRISDWILHKDNQLIVFNKPAGLSVQPDKTGDPSLLGMGAAYVRHDLYLIHRLDRPVSGVVVMGQQPSAQTALTKQLQANTMEKYYLAIVANRPGKDADTLRQYLRNAPGNRSVIDEEPDPTAKLAQLHYKYLGGSDRYHLLGITLKTGRKHQIRCQLASIGCPLRGDTKYGFKRANPDGGIDLHSYRVGYDHPITGERVRHTAPLPEGTVWDAFREMVDAKS
jgi:23S rRNA pseudouridine1911/1915/1917 synthase